MINRNTRKACKQFAQGLSISRVQLVAAPSNVVKEGLLGWISCTLNRSIHLDGIALRRKADGHLALSFPARRDDAGRQHFFLRPLDDKIRRDFEFQIFKALGFEEVARR